MGLSCAWVKNPSWEATCDSLDLGCTEVESTWVDSTWMDPALIIMIIEEQQSKIACWMDSNPHVTGLEGLV